jgi:uncharacterized protein (DUF924 family)
MIEAPAVTAEDVLAFWREAGPECWYKRDTAFDATIRSRFRELWEKAAAGELQSWETSDDGALALVIVLDQFPRNMFRDDARTYCSDALAREVAARAIARGADLRLDGAIREFFYMPFMHSENFADQLHCIELFRQSGNPDSLKYAEGHAEIIHRFGRFPHRNRILGRQTTPEERAFLDQGGFSG